MQILLSKPVLVILLIRSQRVNGRDLFKRTITSCAVDSVLLAAIGVTYLTFVYTARLISHCLLRCHSDYMVSSKTFSARFPLWTYH